MSISDKRLLTAQIQITPLSHVEFERDLEELIAVYQAAYRELPQYSYREHDEIADYLRWLYHADPDGFLVARSPQGELIGFVAVCRHWRDRIHGEVGEIHELVVHPRWQGQGIGRLLMNAGMELLKHEHRLLGLWVGEENHRALRLYHRLGFRETGKVGKWLRMIKRVGE